MSPRAKTVVVTGSHTDVGKTYVACRLVERLVRDGLRVDVRKPVMSGFDPTRAEESDAGRLLAAAASTSGGQHSVPRWDDVSPWRFRDPVAPDAAARAAGVSLALEEIVTFSTKPSPADVVLVETAGGVMSPLTDTSTALDLVERIRAPTILVVGAYLGGISHGLTARLALRTRGVEVRAVVVSRGGAAEAEPFTRFLPDTPVLALPDGAHADHDAVRRLAALLV
jgi:dethiobiotin synthetase